MNDQQRNQIIANYASANLSPTKEQRDRVSHRYEEISGFLTGRCFMSGSFARFTAVRPPHDLDVIWVSADANLTRNPRAILDVLGGELRRLYKSQSNEPVKIEIQDHSINVIFEQDEDGFSIDVVPAAEMPQKNTFGDPIYCVPEIQKLSHMQRKSFAGRFGWILSDPKGYIVEATQLDEKTEGRFRKTAKVAKAWRQKEKVANGDSFRLKAFHLEQLIVRHYKEHPDSTILAALNDTFRTLNQAIASPQIPDRADPKVYIDQYVADLTPAERSKILILQGQAHDLVCQITSASSEEAVLGYLRRLTQAPIQPAVTAPTVIVARPPQPYGDIR